MPSKDFERLQLISMAVSALRTKDETMTDILEAPKLDSSPLLAYLCQELKVISKEKKHLEARQAILQARVVVSVMDLDDAAKYASS